jgi:hypothetical protein
MKIAVTQHHIDTGLRGVCTGDPIALAIKDATGSKAWASPAYLVWGGKKSIQTPESVLEFMKCFDNGYRVSPFEFELEEEAWNKNTTS